MSNLSLKSLLIGNARIKLQTINEDLPGCKENKFYSLPFEQAVTNIYQPESHFY